MSKLMFSKYWENIDTQDVPDPEVVSKFSQRAFTNGYAKGLARGREDVKELEEEMHYMKFLVSMLSYTPTKD